MSVADTYRPETADQHARAARAEHRRRVEDGFSTRAKASERGLQKLEGSPEQVLASMDRRVLESFRLEAPKYGLYSTEESRIVVELDTVDGLKINVSGDDPAWVRKAAAELIAESAKGVPRWSWLRSERGYYLAYVCFTIAALTLLLRFVEDLNDVGAFILLSLYVGLLTGALALGFHHRIVRKRLPGFEILEPGQASRGKEASLFVAALVLQIPLGVFVNLVTR